MRGHRRRNGGVFAVGHLEYWQRMQYICTYCKKSSCLDETSLIVVQQILNGIICWEVIWVTFPLLLLPFYCVIWRLHSTMHCAVVVCCWCNTYHVINVCSVICTTPKIITLKLAANSHIARSNCFLSYVFML